VTHKTLFIRLKSWTSFLIFAGIAGLLLRVLFVEDMEYKEDEEYNFVQTQLIGVTQPWPWHGMNSGVYLANPGMSIWVFAILAKLLGIHQPTSLANAVQCVAWLGIALVVPWTYRRIQDQTERLIWLWSYALAMVNPFLILYQRKLWPEPFLPLVAMLTWMSWWNRSRFLGAFFWGLWGACLGQIHMSGFFLAFTVFIATWIWRRHSTHWRGWFLGSTLGALPLIPWGLEVLQRPIHETISFGLQEIIQLKYWVFWITNPTGLHLGNPLGILRGPSHWNQLSDFVRYPLIGSFPTFLNGGAHLIAGACCLWILAQGLSRLWQSREPSHPDENREKTQKCGTVFLQNAAFWGCGILMTLTGVTIRRYYLAATFPFEFIWLTRLAQPQTSLGKKLLFTLWTCQLFISMQFVAYIHINQGSITGDYGPSYRAQQKAQTLLDAH